MGFRSYYVLDFIRKSTLVCQKREGAEIDVWESPNFFIKKQ
jgi:hypothetical protein